MSRETIPGTFFDAAVGRLRWIRTAECALRGVTIRTYRADVADGVLSAVVGREPAGTDNRPLWHVSVAHRQFVGPEERFVRYPTWDELKHAKYTLVADNVPMVLIFPRRGVPYVNDYPTALHLWESEDGQIDV